MSFIKQVDIFQQKLSEIDSIIFRQNQLPKQVFDANFSIYEFINFDDIFTKDFFEKLKSFLTSINETKLTLAVIKPDPVDYFFKHFNKYPIIEFLADDSFNDYLAAIAKNPGDSEADAIMYNSTNLIIFSESLKWAIYADRDFELGIVGFVEPQLKNLFIASYGSDNVFNLKEAISDILSLVFSNQKNGVPEDIIKQLIVSYK